MPRGAYNPNHPHAKVAVPGDRRSVTVTFNYGGELRSLVAQTRKDAFDAAARAWGLEWDGEPVVSSPASIYRDLTGDTKRGHGQDFTINDADARNRGRFRRTGQPYA